MCNMEKMYDKVWYYYPPQISDKSPLTNLLSTKQPDGTALDLARGMLGLTRTLKYGPSPNPVQEGSTRGARLELGFGMSLQSRQRNCSSFQCVRRLRLVVGSIHVSK